MARDDRWYDEEAWDEDQKDEEPPLSPEVACPRCLHMVARDVPQCPWCGRPLGDAS